MLTVMLVSFMLTTSLSVTYIDTTASSGRSTWYDGAYGTATTCGDNGIYDAATFPFGYYAACGGNVFDNGYGCGKCYEIVCNINPYDTRSSNCSCSLLTSSVIILCNDHCAGCFDTEFQLNRNAMARIVGPGLIETCSSITTTLRRVECEYSSNIKIISKAGSSAYWLGLNIVNVAGYGAIQTIRLKPSYSTSYTTICHKEFNPSYWLCSGGFPLSAPLTVQLTNDNNEISVYEDCISGASLSDNVEFDCAKSLGPIASINDATPTPISDATEATPTPDTDTVVLSLAPSSAEDFCYLQNIEIRTHRRSQIYWLAFFLEGLCPYCSELENVKAKDSSSYQHWVWGWVSSDQEDAYWYFPDNKENHGGQPWTPPITVMMEGTAGELTFTDILSSASGGLTFNSTKSFCRMHEEETLIDDENNAGYVKLVYQILFCFPVIFIIF